MFTGGIKRPGYEAGGVEMDLELREFDTIGCEGCETIHRYSHRIERTGGTSKMEFDEIRHRSSDS